jgi:hypothetical protein
MAKDPDESGIDRATLQKIKKASLWSFTEFDLFRSKRSSLEPQKTTVSSVCLLEVGGH